METSKLLQDPDSPMDRIAEAVERACARIAPTWPLDRFIAVNPLWGLTGRPVATVSAELAALSGSRMVMPHAWYRSQWHAARFGRDDLAKAIDQTGSERTVDELRGLLELEQAPLPRRGRVTDIADAARDTVREMPWASFVIHSLSQQCAAYFDEGQAQLGPDRSGGLYASWRRHACADRSPGLLMRMRDYPALARSLPTDPHALIAAALEALEIESSERERYLAALLLDINGWASWCAYRRFQARLAEGDDGHLVDLLAMRLAWEWLLLRSAGQGMLDRWRIEMGLWPSIDAAAAASQADSWVLQRAVELAYQEPLCRELARYRGMPAPTTPTVQAAFCIDVRSEPLRRALEGSSDTVQTLGFAGFFGLPIEYRPAGSTSAWPQLPGLFSPSLRAADTGLSAGQAERRADRLERRTALAQLAKTAVSGFGFVEAFGPLYAGALLADSLGWVRSSAAERVGLSRAAQDQRKPRLESRVDGQPIALAERVELAARILRGMSLVDGFARLVVLVGHASETVNNPHAAGLQCGACGGRSGEVNARAAAALLNDPEVRRGLADHGIELPMTTHVLAGLHDTGTEEVVLFELDLVPATHAHDVADLKAWLGEAGQLARAERVERLDDPGLPLTPKAFARRARDPSQVRPEWGLANNASFIAAPREHVRHLNLQGRAFLHDYRCQQDAEGSILELIMTAPMVVAHWINFQYYASVVDNERYGSGNKLLHNVVGKHIGVFEGNGGDLRIGLPLQSVHDGARWMHEPLRLSVFLAAPRAAIEAVLARHAPVRALVTNGWIHLLQLDPLDASVHAYRDGGWRPA